MNIVLVIITGLPVADVGASAVVGTIVLDEISLVTVLFGGSAVVGASVSALVSVAVEVGGASVDLGGSVLVISPVVVVGDIASVVSLAINKVLMIEQNISKKYVLTLNRLIEHI